MKNKVDAVSDFFNTPVYLANTFNIALRKAIIKELLHSPITNKKVLDIGCGDGSLSIPFMELNSVVLIDSAKTMLEKANEKIKQINTAHKPILIQGDFLSYSFEEHFDLILCIGVVSHIEDIDQLLHKIKNLLTGNGKAIIQISDASHFRNKNLASNSNSYGYELNRITKTEFTQKLNSVGFKLLKELGYSWSFRPINYLSQKIQFYLLNKIRKTSFLKFLSSEWLFLVEK